MIELNDVLGKLSGVRKSGSGYTALCPAHDDAHNSLSLREADGKVLLHCFAGCSFGSILTALDIKFDPKTPQEEEVYNYTDENGNPLYQVVRYFPKNFKQRRIVDGQYVWNLNGIKPVLFRLPELLNAISQDRIVFFVEGEKDCLNLEAYGLVSTSISGGASSAWQPQYTETLKGARIAIIPDADTAGRKHAEKIANVLYGWAKSLKVLELGSRDVTEWLKTHNPEELQTLWDDTKEYIPIGAVTRDEFQELKGHLIYLSRRFNRQPIKPKRILYK